MGVTTTFHMAALRDSEHLLLPCAPPYPSFPPTHKKQNKTKTPKFVLFGLLKAPGLDGCSFQSIVRMDLQKREQGTEPGNDVCEGELRKSFRVMRKGPFSVVWSPCFYKRWTSCSGHCSGTTKPINFSLNGRTSQGLSCD